MNSLLNTLDSQITLVESEAWHNPNDKQYALKFLRKIRLAIIQEQERIITSLETYRKESEDSLPQAGSYDRADSMLAGEAFAYKKAIEIVKGENV